MLKAAYQYNEKLRMFEGIILKDNKIINRCYSTTEEEVIKVCKIIKKYYKEVK